MSQHVFYSSEDEYLAHSLKDLARKFHKYLLRIKNGKGYRYFYSKDQIDAYMKKLKGNKGKEMSEERKTYTQSQRDAAMAKRTTEENQKKYRELNAEVTELARSGASKDEIDKKKAERDKYAQWAAKSEEGMYKDQYHADVAKDDYKDTREGKKAFKESQKKANEQAKKDENKRGDRTKDQARLLYKEDQLEDIYNRASDVTKKKIEAAIAEVDSAKSDFAFDRNAAMGTKGTGYSRRELAKWDSAVAETEKVLDKLIKMYK